MKAVLLVARNGEKRPVHVPDVTANNVRTVMKKRLSEHAAQVTDEATIYKKIGAGHVSRDSVNHSREEYVNMIRLWVCTNSVESSFALLKRGLMGTFPSICEQHLQRYAHEFDFRWNYRVKKGYDGLQLTRVLLANGGGKRLTYAVARS